MIKCTRKTHGTMAFQIEGAIAKECAWLLEELLAKGQQRNRVLSPTSTQN